MWDLLLLHFPVPILQVRNMVALEENQKRRGKVHWRSNYMVKHLE